MHSPAMSAHIFECLTSPVWEFSRLALSCWSFSAVFGNVSLDWSQIPEYLFFDCYAFSLFQELLCFWNRALREYPSPWAEKVKGNSFSLGCLQLPSVTLHDAVFLLLLTSSPMPAPPTPPTPPENFIQIEAFRFINHPHQKQQTWLTQR